MKTTISIQSGRALMEAAHQAAQAGDETYAHIDGIKKLNVREIEFGNGDSGIATVHCWTKPGECLVKWIVPLNAVFAIKVHDRPAGSSECSE